MFHKAKISIWKTNIMLRITSRKSSNLGSRSSLKYKKKVEVAGLKTTRDEKSKGTQIDLSLFIHQNYITNILK